MSDTDRGDIKGHPRRFRVGHNKRLPWPGRFWAKVAKGDGCWEWQGARRRYGVVQIDGRPQSAHRVSYELAFGSIPAGLLVCHTCDNPPCVRPDHLFLGASADNVADAEAKGRRTYGDRHWTRLRPMPRGEANRSARLTQRQVDEIRAQYVRGVTSIRDLAAAYGVSKSTIGYVVTGETWR